MHEIEGSTKVVVSGAGPSGLTAALVLALQGVEVLVLESGQSLNTESRASTLHPPTLELFDLLGVIDPVLDRGLRVDRFQFRNRDGVLADLDIGVLKDDTRYPYRVQLEQSRVTPILLDALEATGQAQVRFGHKVADVTTVRDGVRILSETAEGPRAYAGSWAVGADGAGSAVRRALELTLEGMTYPDEFMVVTTTFPFEEHLAELSPVNYIADGDDWLVLLRIPQAWRVLFPIAPTARPAENDEECLIRERLGRVTAAARHAPLGQQSLYQVHQRVAERYRVGRVLLIGDAAHVNSPIGGMGMNSGIHDAVAVGLALADVLRGAAEVDALDRVAAERRRLALDVVQRTSDRNQQQLALKDPKEIERREQHLQSLQEDHRLAREHLLESSMLLGTSELLVTARQVLESEPVP